MSKDRISLSPDILVAYVDGELPAEQMDMVEQTLGHDDAARETVRLLRLSADVAARAYAGVLDEPVPERLVTAARRAGAKASEASRRRRQPAWLIPLAASLAALAASLAALILGLAGGYVWRDSNTGYVPAAASQADPLTASYEATLQGALDTGKAGQSFTYESQGLGDGRITLGRNFDTEAGVACREFRRQERRAAAASTDNGIACRAVDGSWTVMLVPGAS
jgi:surface antigen